MNKIELIVGYEIFNENKQSMRDSTCCLGLIVLLGLIGLTVVGMAQAQDSDTWETIGVASFLATFCWLTGLLIAKYAPPGTTEESNFWFGNAKEFRQGLAQQQERKQREQRATFEKFQQQQKLAEEV